MKRSGLVYIVIAAVAILLFPISARAGCSNPTNSENKLVYNSDYHTYQFCNGTNWIIAGQAGTPAYTFFGDTNIETDDDNGNSNLLLAQQATLSYAGTIQSLSFYVTAAAGNLRLGIYDATGPSGGPGNLLAQTNGFVPITGWNKQNVITPVALAAGNYWLAYLPDNDGLSFKKENNTGPCKLYAYTYGAMPATYSTTPTDCSNTNWSFYATLAPACGSPSGVEGNIKYNTDYHTLQYCNGASWIPLGSGSGGSGGNCSSPTGSPGQFVYNQDYHTYQYCNGTNWVKFGGGSSVSLPGSSDGYFVMSKTTWTGNLGQQAGADAKCLTDLTTNTGWKGYVDANARGLLNPSHVHAFMCGDVVCYTGSPNKTYYFADANNSSHGGNKLTTDSSRTGPNDTADWSQADYFGSGYAYWTDMAGSSTIWWNGGATQGIPNDCSSTSDFDSASGSLWAPAGVASGGNTRWWGLNQYCNVPTHLICFVEP